MSYAEETRQKSPTKSCFQWQQNEGVFSSLSFVTCKYSILAIIGKRHAHTPHTHRYPQLVFVFCFSSFIAPSREHNANRLITKHRSDWHWKFHFIFLAGKTKRITHSPHIYRYGYENWTCIESKKEKIIRNRIWSIFVIDFCARTKSSVSVSAHSVHRWIRSSHG